MPTEYNVDLFFFFLQHKGQLKLRLLAPLVAQLVTDILPYNA